MVKQDEVRLSSFLPVNEYQAPSRVPSNGPSDIKPLEDYLVSGYAVRGSPLKLFLPEGVLNPKPENRPSKPFNRHSNAAVPRKIE